MRSSSIKDYFGKAQRPKPASPAIATPAAEPAGPEPPSSLPSSPVTPVKAPAKPLARGDEIRGSDEEDDDSDDSIESLSAFFGQKKDTAAAYQRDANLTSTPKAKRIASGGAPHRSPLTLQQKGPRKHKFDLKALMRDSAQDDKFRVSAQRADELANESDGDSLDYDGEGGDSAENKDGIKKTAIALLEGQEEGKGDKLVRAIDRTSTKSSSRRRCYFFDPSEAHAQSAPLLSGLRKGGSRPFPDHKAKGRWKFLEDPSTRDQAFIHGLAHTVLSKGKELPRELFLWILDQTCIEQNTQLRLKYCSLVAENKNNISRLVDEARLYAMLQSIGGPGYHGSSAETPKLESTLELEEPYPGRDWSTLISFLSLLKQMAPNLNATCVLHAIQLLLRMSLDPVIRVVACEDHAEALTSLIETLPGSGAAWDRSCRQLASYLSNSLDDVCLLVVAITSIRPASTQLSDLRRRLATAVLSGDASWAASAPDSVITLDNIMGRLDEADFAVDSETNYDELKARIKLLDLVINDAEFLRRPPPSSHNSSRAGTPGANTSTSPTTHGKAPLASNKPSDTSKSTRGIHPGSGLAPPPPHRRQQQQRPGGAGAGGDQEQQRLFDAQVDRLTSKLRACLHDRIHDNNSPDRKEARTAADVLTKRLTYGTRSRPPPKTSIFDDPDVRRRLGLRVGGSGEEDEAERKDLEKRKDFMKSWATKGEGEGGGGASK